ncbi:MAG: carbonic anhydrase [Nibricoccus sp.]
MKNSKFTRLLGPLAVLVLFAIAASADTGAKTNSVTPETALAKLVEGNKRFVSGNPGRNTPTAQQWAELAKGQHPFAIILTCADSRLSPEIIFDQGLGELFVIRNAGNLADDHVLGSIEYAVEHLGASLIVVLGHTKCGAVTAAASGGEAPGHIKSIVESLSGAVTLAKKKPGDTIDNAIRISSKLTVADISKAEPILSEAVKSAKVKVVAAKYDIATGAVEFLQ